MSLWVTGLMLSLALFPQEPQPKPLPNPAAEAKVRHLLETLPAGSLLRRALEEGERGDGIRQPWMNDMQRQRVKVALARVKFDWDEVPTNPTVVWARYLAKYTVDYDDIRHEADRPRHVKVSAGLDSELREQVRLKAREALPEIMKDAQWRGARGTVTVLLFDDEWLPSGVHAIPDVDMVTIIDATELMAVVRKCGVYWDSLVPPSPLDKQKVEEAHRHAEAEVRRLLAALTEVNAKSLTGTTALGYAVGSCRPSVINLLLRAGADLNVGGIVGETPLLTAACQNRVDIVEILLNAGAQVDTRDRVYGGTPLVECAEQSNTVIVQRLLAAGADVNAADNTGRTVLIRAVDSDSANPEVVRMLLAAHANVNARAKNGQTALSTAMRRASMNSALNERFLEIAELLRQAGARE